MAATDQKASKQTHVYMETGFITTNIVSAGKRMSYLINGMWTVNFSYRKMKSDPYLNVLGKTKGSLDNNIGESL